MSDSEREKTDRLLAEARALYDSRFRARVNSAAPGMSRLDAIELADVARDEAVEAVLRLHSANARRQRLDSIGALGAALDMRPIDSEIRGRAQNPGVRTDGVYGEDSARRALYLSFLQNGGRGRN